MVAMEKNYECGHEKEQARSFTKDLFAIWDENKKYIKVGIRCLALGLAIGFVKGTEVNAKSLSELADAIPKAPKAAIDISFEDLPDVLSLFTKEEVIRMCNDLTQKGLMMTEKDI